MPTSQTTSQADLNLQHLTTIAISGTTYQALLAARSLKDSSSSLARPSTLCMQDVLQCFHKDAETDHWQATHMPRKLQDVLLVLRVPYSPSVWQEAPYIPRNCR